MTETLPSLSIDVEVGPGFDPSALKEEAAGGDIALGVSSGLNADRIIKLITDLRPDTLEAISLPVLRTVEVAAATIAHAEHRFPIKTFWLKLTVKGMPGT